MDNYNVEKEENRLFSPRETFILLVFEKKVNITRLKQE